MVQTLTDPITEPLATPADDLPIQAIDHVEFYVGNAKQAAHFYRTTLRLPPRRLRRPRDQGPRPRLLRPRAGRDPLRVHLRPRSRLRNRPPRRCATATASRTSRCASTTRPPPSPPPSPAAPSPVRSRPGSRAGKAPSRQAAIKTYGDTVHTFVNRANYHGAFAPGFSAGPTPSATPPVGFRRIDHVVGNVELGKMNRWVDFYARVLGFSQLVHFDDQAISTEYSALMSKVMQDGTGKIKFPINEPAEGKTQEPDRGVPRLQPRPRRPAHRPATDDIVATVEAMQRRGIAFLRIPGAYYEDLPDRIGQIDEPLDALERLGILADRDDDGYLLQIFTKGVQDRPTALLRDHRAPRRPRLRRRQLQGPLRGPRSRASPPRQPVGEARVTSARVTSRGVTESRSLEFSRDDLHPRASCLGLEFVAMRLATYRHPRGQGAAAGRRRSGRPGARPRGRLLDEAGAARHAGAARSRARGIGRAGRGRRPVRRGAPRDSLCVPSEVAVPAWEVELLAPLPRPRSLRDFYAFEQHVATAHRKRGREVPPAWYEIPVFYFGHAGSIYGPDAADPETSRARTSSTSSWSWPASSAGRAATSPPRRRRAHRRLHDHERLERPRHPAPGDERRARPGQGQGLRHLARPLAGHARRAGRSPGRRPLRPDDGRPDQRRGAHARQRRRRSTAPSPR